MVLYATTIFVSAYLLFQVQPMVARFILPWFGGSSLVWTTCMLFFQSALVFGYGYAHFVNQRMKPRIQWISHAVLLAVAVCMLPIKPTDFWKPEDATFPTFRILLLLAASVGLPFFILSTTGPLVQAWQSKTHPDRSPYRLFALSNFASLAALISYPFLVERYLTVNAQSWFWSGVFCLFAVLVLTCGIRFARNEHDDQATAAGQDEATNTGDERIGGLQLALWLVLPMLASIQLLATTNLMTQEIGSLPFLWILPLSLYLLSFIICFDHTRWYWRPFFYLLFFASAVFSAFVLEAGANVPIAMQMIGYSAVCFAASMCCHGELARSKPGSQHLTRFYLMVSIGGALGGIFVALVAPRIFVGYYEFQIGLVAAILACLTAYGMQQLQSERSDAKTSRPNSVESPTGKKKKSSLAGFGATLFAGLLVLFFVLASLGTQWVWENGSNVHLKLRNEYGTLTVKDFSDRRKLTNGKIEHGFQFKDETWLNHPTSYYGPKSGLGFAMDYLHFAAEQNSEPGIDIAAIGLGVGTVCSWCNKGDTLRFFEINPQVLKVAESEFWYLKNCQARDMTVVLGDARLQLEREIVEQDSRRYDVLIADAFSSDSIPMHLLTLEAMEIYKQRLKPNGILAFHASNRFLVLDNIVKLLAEEIGLSAFVVDDKPSDRDSGLYNNSTWILVTADPDFETYANEPATGMSGTWPNEKYIARWTDDFSSIIPVIKVTKDLKWFEDFGWLTRLLDSKGWTKSEGD